MAIHCWLTWEGVFQLKHYHYKYYGVSASIHDTKPVHTVKNLQQQLSRSLVSTYKSIRKKKPSLQINDKPLQPRKKRKKRKVDLLSWALVYSSLRAFSYQFVSNVKWKESDPCNVPKNVIREMQACSFWRWCSALAWFGIWITLLRVGVVVPLWIHFCAPSTVVLRSSVLLVRIYISVW